METAILEKAIEQQYSKLLKEAQNILRQPHDAEDAVQTACMKAWSHYPQTGISVCEAWLKTIVYHECITIIRERSRYGVPVDAEVICSLCDAEDHVVDHIDKVSIRDMIESLPAEYALLIKLRYYEGMSVREIAQRFQKSPSTIGCRLFRARRMLHARCSMQ